MKLLFCIFLVFIATGNSIAQDVLKGRVVDENFQPIPFADIFLRGPQMNIEFEQI